MLKTTVEAQPELLALSLSILKWLGISSVAGFLGLYATWLRFPPELVIDTVVDKSKKFQSESKIRVRNSGTLPAHRITADAESIHAQIGGMNMKDVGAFSGREIVSRLSSGESAEITISPGIQMDQAMEITRFSYTLTLKCEAKLFFFKKKLRKRWTIELRNFEGGYDWQVAPA